MSRAPGTLDTGVAGSLFPQRVGHGGASALVAGNTLASFDAAQEIGVDVIEFDVRDSEDAREGAQAFAEKRPPNWRGR